MELINADEIIIYETGKQRINQNKNEPDYLLITNKRLYHISKDTYQNGKHTIINLEEVKKVEYFKNKINPMLFFFVTLMLSLVSYGIAVTPLDQIIQIILLIIIFALMVFALFYEYFKGKSILNYKITHNGGTINFRVLASEKEVDKINYAIFNSKEKLQSNIKSNTPPFKPKQK